MALLNVSLWLHLTNGPKKNFELKKWPLSFLLFQYSNKTSFLSASPLVADPAIAFKGGGPYGQEVTRDLSGKDFSGKTLIKQNFKTSVLRQAKFKGAKLLRASFFDAYPTGADLSDADLRGADFSLANVTKANLNNANFEGALATGNTSLRGPTQQELTSLMCL